MAKNWVDVVGYRYEVVHTGVLAALLRDQRYGLKVAQRLSGLHDIESVGPVEVEKHAGGRARTKPDLLAHLKTADGSQRRMAVETKVDSAATREQMTGTAAQGDAVVLLAVGLTSLQLSDLTPGLFSDASESWQVTDLEEWLKILHACGPLDHPLADYVASVEEEHRNHQGARDAARAGGTFVGDARGKSGDLCDWAWLAEFALDIDKGGAGRFSCKTYNGGPHMYWHESGGELAGGGSLYIDVYAASGKRSLDIKAENVSLDRRVKVWEVGAKFADVGNRGSRPGPGKAKSFKITTVSLDDMSLGQAGERALEMRHRVRDLCDLAG